MGNAKEGSLYKSITVGDNTFHIYYGYYSDLERGRWGPTPIFPDFARTPIFTREGTPYARADQDICPSFDPKPTVSGENWCHDCRHFALQEEVLGLCQCKERNVNLAKAKEINSAAEKLSAASPKEDMEQ